MAEAPEHIFLSEKFLEILREFSQLDLYSYREADRKRFDFTCNLLRDWNRVLVGQTLWKHVEGIDKDIRTLLTDAEASIWAYVARDTVKNRSLLAEVVNDFRSTNYQDQLHKLKVFWIPEDFNADSEEARTVVGNVLKEAVVQDILFNVLFGNLTGDDIRFLQISSPSVAMNLAVLYEIAHQQHTTQVEIARKYGRKASVIKQSIHNLLGRGFLWQEGILGSPHISIKGRTYLSFLYRLYLEGEKEEVLGGPSPFDPEFKYIMRKLGLDPDVDDTIKAAAVRLDDAANLSEDELLRRLVLMGKWSPYDWCGHVFTTIYTGIEKWGLDLSNLNFIIPEQEMTNSMGVIR